MNGDYGVVAFGILFLVGYVVSLITDNHGLIFFLGFFFSMIILNEIKIELKERNHIEREFKEEYLKRHKK